MRSNVPGPRSNVTRKSDSSTPAGTAAPIAQGAAGTPANAGASRAAQNIPQTSPLQNNSVRALIMKTVLRRDPCLAEWKAWANTRNQEIGENRPEAVKRMKACLSKSNSENNRVYLRLDNLGLTSLPETLPAGITCLYASNNRLTRLPQNLPNTLRAVQLENNQFTSPPVLPEHVVLIDGQLPMYEAATTTDLKPIAPDLETFERFIYNKAPAPPLPAPRDAKATPEDHGQSDEDWLEFMNLVATDEEAPSHRPPPPRDAVTQDLRQQPRQRDAKELPKSLVSEFNRNPTVPGFPNLYRVSVPGDGDCLFHSVIHHSRDTLAKHMRVSPDQVTTERVRVWLAECLTQDFISHNNNLPASNVCQFLVNFPEDGQIPNEHELVKLLGKKLAKEVQKLHKDHILHVVNVATPRQTRGLVADMMPHLIVRAFPGLTLSIYRDSGSCENLGDQAEGEQTDVPSTTARIYLAREHYEPVYERLIDHDAQAASDKEEAKSDAKPETLVASDVLIDTSSQQRAFNEKRAARESGRGDSGSLVEKLVENRLSIGDPIHHRDEQRKEPGRGLDAQLRQRGSDDADPQALGAEFLLHEGRVITIHEVSTASSCDDSLKTDRSLVGQAGVGQTDAPFHRARAASDEEEAEPDAQSQTSRQSDEQTALNNARVARKKDEADFESLVNTLSKNLMDELSQHPLFSNDSDSQHLDQQTAELGGLVDENSPQRMRDNSDPRALSPNFVSPVGRDFAMDEASDVSPLSDLQNTLSKISAERPEHQAEQLLGLGPKFLALRSHEWPPAVTSLFKALDKVWPLNKVLEVVELVGVATYASPEAAVKGGANVGIVADYCRISDPAQIIALEKIAVNGRAGQEVMAGENTEIVARRHGIISTECRQDLELLAFDGASKAVDSGQNVRTVALRHGINSEGGLSALEWCAVHGPAGKAVRSGDNVEDVARRYGIEGTETLAALGDLLNSR